MNAGGRATVPQSRRIRVHSWFPGRNASIRRVRLKLGEQVEPVALRQTARVQRAKARRAPARSSIPRLNGAGRSQRDRPHPYDPVIPVGIHQTGQPHPLLIAPASETASRIRLPRRDSPLPSRDKASRARLTHGNRLHRNQCRELSRGPASTGHARASVACLDARLVAPAPAAVRVCDVGRSVARGGRGRPGNEPAKIGRVGHPDRAAPLPPRLDKLPDGLPAACRCLGGGRKFRRRPPERKDCLMQTRTCAATRAASAAESDAGGDDDGPGGDS